MRRQIGIRELREHLSGAVNAVMSGEEITITMRGRPVAHLVPPGRTTDEEFTLDDLASVGLIEPPRRKDHPEPPAPHLLPADVRLDRVLEHLRGRT